MKNILTHIILSTQWLVFLSTIGESVQLLHREQLKPNQEQSNENGSARASMKNCITIPKLMLPLRLSLLLLCLLLEKTYDCISIARGM